MLSTSRAIIDIAQLRYHVSKLPIFLPSVYLSLNGDLPQSINAIDHFVEHGIWEGRGYCTGQSVVAGLRRLDPFCYDTQMLPESEFIDAVSEVSSRGVSLYVHRQSDVQARLRAELIAVALMSRGIPVQLCNELDAPGLIGQRCIYFAPHEFFFLPGGGRWLTKDVVSSAVLYPTQPLHITPAAQILPLLFSCYSVVDDNVQNCSIYMKCGIPFCNYIPLPVGEDDFLVVDDNSDALGRSVSRDLAEFSRSQASWLDRPLDMCFFGASNVIRDDIFLRGAATFESLNCFISYPEQPRGPATSRARGRQRTSLQNIVARSSKVVLDIDAEEIGSLSWYESCILGFLNKSLVVTRNRYSHPMFRPGEHYIEETSRNIPDFIRWIVSTKDGSELGRKIGMRAYKTLTELHGRDIALENLIKALWMSKLSLST